MDDASSLTSEGNQDIADSPWFFNRYLDKSIPYPRQRWLVTLVLATIFFLRVYYVPGFLHVAAILGCIIFSLGDLLSPKEDEDPDLDEESLPIQSSDEFRPFVWYPPEFDFWYDVNGFVCVCLGMTTMRLFSCHNCMEWKEVWLRWFVFAILSSIILIIEMIRRKVHAA